MGDRDASLEGEELHNNSPIFTNLQKIEIDVYGTAPDLDFRCTNMGTITLFFLWNKALIIFAMYFFDQLKKKASIDYAV